MWNYFNIAHNSLDWDRICYLKEILCKNHINTTVTGEDTYPLWAERPGICMAWAGATNKLPGK